MESLWINNRKNEMEMRKLCEDKHTDVCIIGGGMFGIMTGYFLLKQGKRVIILEKDVIGGKTTGHTTAKVTSQHGTIYAYLAEKYGVDFARKYFEANEKGIQDIWKVVEENQIECQLEKQDSYVYATTVEEENKVVQEYEALKKITDTVELVSHTDLPFPVKKAVKLKEQAQFHPLEYLDGVAKAIVQLGGEIFEHTICEDLKKEKESYACKAGKYTVHAKSVVIATHYPFISAPGFYFAKMYQASSYVIGVDTKTNLGEGMYINPANPVFSYRTVEENGRKILLLGGAGHKTGVPVTEEQTYGVLEKEAKKWYPEAEILYKWSTRDCITLDKIPYIGTFSTMMPNVYVGTGFNKWGMTSSHVAARMVSDKILEKKNAYEEVFQSTRMHPIVNREEVKNMVTDVTKGLIEERMEKETLHIEDIANGDGGIVEIEGKKVGVYKDEMGKLYTVKPVCTHLGCILEWNGADKTWDCPCHGSRFAYDGTNLYEPANKDLEKIEIKVDF